MTELMFYFLIGNLTSTSVMSVMCSWKIVLRRWRAWIHNKLPPPSWASSRGEHLPYLLDQTPRLLFISLRNFVRLLFESGVYCYSVKSYVIVKVLRKASCIRSRRIAMWWLGCEANLPAWSAAVLLQSGTYTVPPISFLVFFQWFHTMIALRAWKNAKLL